MNAILKSWYRVSISDPTNQNLKLPACQHIMARDFILPYKTTKSTYARHT